ncbi:MAG: PEPxxWA-CTERM sorting domain-containing protein [Candidatus Sphingomonas colombiensis]|nr:PEPxxWA-CTERM sorting domain-containing protein [Sphingomonas sp.]WEK42497.1 MAG: PEPxxWA-CTERM sorting domain-containing protein [Sphingomonas sp.]
MGLYVKKTAVGFAAATFALAFPSVVNAAVTVDGYTLKTGSFGAQTGVHSSGSPAGHSIDGYVNQDGSTVTFSSVSGLLSFGGGSGEATINSTPSMTDLNVLFQKSWNSVTFDFMADKKVTSAFTLLVNGTALFSATPNLGDPACTFCLIDNGGNKFTVSGPGISNLAFTFDPGIPIAKQFRVEGLSNGGGVPEPATWAMMILGFGAVGGIMRRRGATQAKLRFARA